MSRKGKGIKVALLLSAMSFAMALTGCGKEPAESGNGQNNVSGTGELSKAEYVGLLGDAFGYKKFESDDALFSDVPSDNTYYAEIQAGKEWGILTEEGNFSPNDKATLGFAVDAAVRAIGLDEIEASGVSVDESNLASFYVDNIAQIDVSNPDVAVTGTTAQQILEYAVDYRHILTLPQVCEVDLIDGVKEAVPGIFLNADGETGTLSDPSAYQVGDVIYWDASEHNLAQGVKITEINGNTFRYTIPNLEEVFETIHVSGTYDGTIVNIQSASDSAYAGLASDLYDEFDAYGLSSNGDYQLMQLANGIQTDFGGDHAVFKANIDNATFTVGIKDIKVTVDYDHEAFRPLAPKKVMAQVKFNTEVSSHIEGSISKAIPLGQVDINVAGPVTLRLKLVANLGADGEITLSYTTTNVLDVGWKKGTGISHNFKSTPHLDFEAQVTLTAEAKFLVDLRIGIWELSYSIVNAEVAAGVVATAKVEADLLGNLPTCIDVLIYVPLRWGINQEGCLLTDIIKDAKYSQTIWDSTNSPIQLHFHFEDLVRTPGDVCTRGEGEEVVQENTTEAGEPLPDYHEFKFEKVEFDFIELSSYTMYTGVGETMGIGITSTPDGYSESDLVYTVEDGSVCSVSGGVVVGKAPGSTIVKISTPDGVFTTSLAVTVNEDYKIEGFERLEDM